MSIKNFYQNLPFEFIYPKDEIEKRLLSEYGAIFAAKNVVVPKTIIFKDEREVSKFQSSLEIGEATIGGYKIELQLPAMRSLENAVGEARKNNLQISPRGVDSARRSYKETVTLWASRVEPGLKFWLESGKLSRAQAERIKALSPFAQVREIFKLEDEGIYFSKDLSKSIIYSVAPPGASQHLSMLALDVKEHENAKVREILAEYGWFQTVVSDLPHFTFLGFRENELSALGLKKVFHAGRFFWIPDVGD